MPSLFSHWKLSKNNRTSAFISADWRRGGGFPWKVMPNWRRGPYIGGEEHKRASPSAGVWPWAGHFACSHLAYLSSQMGMASPAVLWWCRGPQRIQGALASHGPKFHWAIGHHPTRHTGEALHLGIHATQDRSQPDPAAGQIQFLQFYPLYLCSFLPSLRLSPGVEVYPRCLPTSLLRAPDCSLWSQPFSPTQLPSLLWICPSWF